jgi:exodeoxyribonuclease V alpha subunit
LTPTIPLLRAHGVLSALDDHFAAALGRLAGEERPWVLLAAALVSRQVALGHVCLDLAQIAGKTSLAGDAGEPLTGLRWLEPGRWSELLRTSPLVADDDEAAATPLVLDRRDRLYLRRYFEHERRLADDLVERAREVEASIDPSLLEADLARLFPAPVASEPRGARAGASRRRVDAQLDLPLGRPAPSPASAAIDAQRDAARMAVTRRLCVVSGGPGTGKTSAVVKILALLTEQEVAAGRKPPRALLLAPTGKAAMRLTDAIRREKLRLACPDAVAAAIPEQASTLHRALGVSDRGGTRFRHHRENPLVADVVLVDEASMVDLALLARLVDAVPPSARLILLGDKDQLASVEAGAVLGELCAAEGSAETPLARCIVRLTHSFRYTSGSGIAALAGAINDGDVSRALDVLGDPRFADVERVDPARDAALSDSLRDAVVDGFRPYLVEDEPERRLAALEHFRVLCAHRRGPHGVERANDEIEEALEAAALIDRSAGASYAGRPLIVTRNDYQLQLFNGDVGTIVEADGRKLAFFVAADRMPRLLSPARLPPHETAFAMTVHKSQGSEFDRVAVLLGDRPSPLATRELLYTAVTRARRHVTLHATEEVLAEAVARPTERASGLRDALRRRALA